MENNKERTLFIGIGAQKTGTTWMADYLTNHPEVMFSPIKELHYFSAKYISDSFNQIFIKKLRKRARLLDNKLSRRIIDEMKLYLERLSMVDEKDYLNFLKSRVRDEKVFGEITPAYSMLDSDSFRKIYELHPKVKFIFGMRSPIDRFWSHMRYTKNFQKDFDPLKSFDEKLNDKQYLLRTDYKRTIIELEKAVPKEEIFYYFYEDLFSDKGEDVVKSLTEFLGIEYMPPEFGRNVNVSKKIELPKELEKKAWNKFEPIVEFVKEHFGRVPEQWMIYENNK